MQSRKVACITRELEDLLMIEEERGTLQKKVEVWRICWRKWKPR